MKPNQRATVYTLLERNTPGREIARITCMVTAEGVSRSDWAARAKLKSRAASLNTRSCRKVAFFIKY